MNVLIRKRIHAEKYGKSSADVIVEKWVEIPFIPFVGLYIWDSDGFEATIAEVGWKIGSAFIECWVEAHKEDVPIDKVVEEFISMGWKRA